MSKIKLYFTSDTHGYIYPTDYRDQSPKALGLLNIINQFKKDGNTLIIDGGDTIQGSPFATFLSSQSFDKHPIAQVLNAGRYDFVTLGNHDFNYDYNYLSRYLHTLDALCLCANVTDKTDQLPIQPYAIKTMANGIKVGLIGCTTDFVPVWEKEEHLENFNISSAYNAFKTAYEIVKPSVDLLIGIYHGGFAYDLQTHQQLSTTNENIAYTLCKDFDIDVLLTGHQHLPIAGQSLFGTHIAQTPENGQKYIEMTLSFKGHQLQEICSDLITPPINPHPLMYQTLQPLETSVNQWLDEPVGVLDVPLKPTLPLDMALNGSSLANFINQVQLEVSGANISCTSFGNSVKGFETSVTVRDVVSTYIYPNTLVVLEVTGDILLKALERCASYFDISSGTLKVSNDFLKPKIAHYNYDYFSNIHYAFDLTKEVGQRVKFATYQDTPIDKDKTYTLVMNNYRATGTGGYDFYKEATVIKEIQIEMSEIIIRYFQKHHHVTVDKTTYLHCIY